MTIYCNPYMDRIVNDPLDGLKDIKDKSLAEEIAKSRLDYYKQVVSTDYCHCPSNHKQHIANAQKAINIIKSFLYPPTLPVYPPTLPDNSSNDKETLAYMSKLDWLENENKENYMSKLDRLEKENKPLLDDKETYMSKLDWLKKMDKENKPLDVNENCEAVYIQEFGNNNYNYELLKDDGLLNDHPVKKTDSKTTKWVNNDYEAKHDILKDKDLFSDAPTVYYMPEISEDEEFREKDMNFEEALDTLCDQMGVNKGVITVTEGGMKSCSVHYSLTGKNGIYATQVFGTVIDVNDDITCYIMVVQVLPCIDTKNTAYAGYWCSNRMSWIFSE